MLCRDIVLPHEVGNLQVGINLPGGLCGFSPGEVVSLRWGSSSPSLPGISPMFGQVASLLVADEALAISNVLHSFTRGEVDLIHIHSIGIGVRISVSQRYIAVSSSSEFPELYHVLVKLSCLVKPLFPFPAGLFLPIREGGGSHHDGELLGYSSLEGVYQDAVIVDSTVFLGQFESGGVLVEVSIELVHAEGIDSLAGSVLKVFWDEGFLKGFAYF